MSSETANRYFQGKENVAMALARRRIKSGGDVKAALSLIPITKPIYARYRELRRGRVSAPAVSELVRARSGRIDSRGSRARPCDTRTRQ